jgi:carbamoyltransferase
VALNCLANRKLGEYFENIWIMPCPGDAGNSLGAAALAHGRRLRWTDAFLGHEIPGEYPVAPSLIIYKVIESSELLVVEPSLDPEPWKSKSPRRPRGSDIKDQVNEIKRRQKFRPFAPVILAEQVDEFFDMPRGWSHSPYMQSIARCRSPDLYPAICHVDNTSRVQTVPADGSGIRRSLRSLV